MKKILISLFVLFLLVVSPVYAVSESVSAEITPTLTQPTKVPDYQLPYPGLLPDNPLYFTKVFRDRLIGFLIADPLKKAEFNLLQADKRLNTSVVLAEKGKRELAGSTLSKGENYFEEAIAQLELAQKQGMDTKQMVEKMSRALQKHEEVIKKLSFPETYKRLAGFEKRVDALASK